MFQSALQRRQAPLIYLGIAAISLPAGMLVARSQSGVSLPLIALTGLVGLVILASLPPSVLFIGWFALAPYLQSSADVSALGRLLTWALYTGPALLLLVLTVARRDQSARLSRVDFLPAAYAAYALASIALTTNLLRSNTVGTAKAFLVIVAIGAIVYYYLTIGPGSKVSSQLIFVALLVGAVVQGVLAMVEYATAWNLWHDTGWHGVLGGGRVVSTLANPGVLGMFLGTGIATAVAILTWRGPRTLRRLSWVVLAVAVPGLLATLTRGPILATAIAVVLLLLLGRARLLGFGVLVVGAVALVLLLPSFKKTDVYQNRVAEKSNVQFRQVIQDWSIRLAAQKPLFGWGYGSFDRVKNTSGFDAEGVPIRNVLEYTSHDTYLTILVELGGLGLLLLVAPFLYLGIKSIMRVRVRGPDSWLIAASLASLLVIFLSASTLDFRFFSLALALPFVFLAVLRRATAASEA